VAPADLVHDEPMLRVVECTVLELNRRVPSRVRVSLIEPEAAVAVSLNSKEQNDE
jgi:hypothetical protein